MTFDFDNVDIPSQDDINACVSFSEEDKAEYDLLVAGLGVSNVGSLGPHSIRPVREASKKYQATNILEIGFNVGYSTSMWLKYQPNASIVSVDCSDRPATFTSASVLKEKHGERFEYVSLDSVRAFPILIGLESAPMLDHTKTLRYLPPRRYDLAFIDGDHEDPGVAYDIAIAILAGAKYIVMDDWWHICGPGVQPCVSRFSLLSKVGQWGNVIMFEVKGETPWNQKAESPSITSSSLLETQHAFSPRRHRKSSRSTDSPQQDSATS